MLAYPLNLTGLCRCCASSKPKLLLCIGFVIAVIFFSYDTLKRKMPTPIRCSNSASEYFLYELCGNYTKRLASGSLCHPLCTGQVTYKQCLGHGITPHVLKASWKGTNIILKVKTVLDKNLPLNSSLMKSKQFDRNYFNINANLSYIKHILDEKRIVNMETLDYMFSECAGYENGVLSYQKMWYCQALLAREFLLSVLLKDSLNVPKLYGTCGHVFAVEDAPDAILGGRFFDYRPWDTKVKLALAFLDMVERLDNTTYGTLYICDFKFANFGVLSVDSGYLVKPIDMDMAWLPSQMKRVMVKESARWCSKDSDCRVAACLSKCNQWTHHCDPDFYTNNLINTCRWIFTNAKAFRYGLFDQGVPQKIQRHLSNLLKICSTPSDEPSPPTSTSMVKDLRQVLHKSIGITFDG